MDESNERGATFTKVQMPQMPLKYRKRRKLTLSVVKQAYLNVKCVIVSVCLQYCIHSQLNIKRQLQRCGHISKFCKKKSIVCCQYTDIWSTADTELTYKPNSFILVNASNCEQLLNMCREILPSCRILDCMASHWLDDWIMPVHIHQMHLMSAIWTLSNGMSLGLDNVYVLSLFCGVTSLWYH